MLSYHVDQSAYVYIVFYMQMVVNVDLPPICSYSTYYRSVKCLKAFTSVGMLTRRFGVAAVCVCDADLNLNIRSSLFLVLREARAAS